MIGKPQRRVVESILVSKKPVEVIGPHLLYLDFDCTLVATIIGIRALLSGTRVLLDE